MIFSIQLKRYIMKYLFLPLILLSVTLFSQNVYWQQKADYEMEIDMDVKTHIYKGKQKITYTNNSPDTLKKVYYHLYFNAFQPGSMMDVRSRNLPDPDERVGDRISKLKDDETGYQKILTLTQDGKKLEFEEHETILKVTLAEPILPGKTVVFELTNEARIPLQIRRCGRNNKEGIDYSFSQWYPKLCEYDKDGWHPNPYIAREFYGVWGNFDVKISIDSSYILGATGVLQNPEEIGKGYGKKTSVINSQKLTWHFKAESVHDFMWAADPDYTHTTRQVENGPLLHFLYQASEDTKAWKELPEYTEKLFTWASEHFGKYPYPVYSVIQGGDGGMEYPMATLITGKRGKGSLVGVTVHEAFHSWYQCLLATDEAQYPWMDEGFTTYASNRAMQYLFNTDKDKAQESSYLSYAKLAASGLMEPICTHADHYNTNFAYGVGSYSMGSIFLHQLSYVIGQEALDNTLKKYFNEWAFKHPHPRDFIRIAEKVSDMELDWYLEYWTQSTKHLDYAVKSVDKNKKGTTVELERKGDMIMPVDVKIEYINGNIEYYSIPLSIMYNHKNDEYNEKEVKPLEAWKWVNPIYSLDIDVKTKEIKSVEIDPLGKSADLNLDNNKFNVN
jgi:hypothetical protein